LSVRRIGACPPESSSRSTPVRPHNGTRSARRGSNSVQGRPDGARPATVTRRGNLRQATRRPVWNLWTAS
jgi:hypothetical protein